MKLQVPKYVKNKVIEIQDHYCEMELHGIGKAPQIQG